MPDASVPDHAEPTRWPGLRQRLVRQARLTASRVWDRPITWELFGAPLTLPLSSDLPYFMSNGGAYGTNVGRLARALAGAGLEPVCIDIGANVGDTAVILQAHVPGMQVLCVEADQGYYDNLLVNVRDRSGITAVLTLVGDGTVSSGLAVTRARGTGQVRPGSSTTSVPTASVSQLVAQFPAFGRASLFKTDTDGYDFAILSGALPWLASTKPVVFTEYDPVRADEAASAGPSGPEVLASLGAIGYGPAVLWDNCGFPHATLDIRDTDAVDDLDTYIRLRPDFYVDLAVFPDEQAELAAALRLSERAFFT